MSIFGIVIGGWGLFVHQSFDQSFSSDPGVPGSVVPLAMFIKYTWDSAGFSLGELSDKV